jgi:two-component system, LytTR family, sensor kinase
MKSLKVYTIFRLLLNIVFIGFILFASANNNDKNLPLGFIVLYNIMLFLPAWINNFCLLPHFRHTKKTVRYLILMTGVFLLSVITTGYYLQHLYHLFNTNKLSDFTSLAATSSAPKGLENYQSYFDVFPGIIIIISAMATGYALQEYLLKIKKNKQIQEQQVIAELSLLKSQISPHFLFNVLNSLYALSLKMSQETPAVVLKLSDILRYSLYESQTKEIFITHEIHVLNTYIDIERLRIPTNAQISFRHTEVIESARIAPMLLLPLVENAFKHGIDSTIDVSYIDIDLSCNNNSLIFTCTNNFKETSAKDFGGIGIANIRKRLTLLYPEKHSLTIKKDKDVFTARLEINFK